MSAFVFDIETDGLLPDVTTMHSLVLRDVETGEVHSYWQDGHADNNMRLQEGLCILAEADMLIGHNVMDYDLRAIKKLFPSWSTRAIVRDTLVLSRLIYPDIRDRDFRNARKNPEMPPKLYGRHSLEAWGHRLGNYKGDFKGPWDTWTPEMQTYCEQDTLVTQELWKLFQTKGWPEDVVKMEHDIAAIMIRQEEYGFHFNEKDAALLYAKLIGTKEGLHAQLAQVFPPKVVRTPFIPKRNNKTKGYVAGVEILKERVVDFNPSSRDHIAERLEEQGWKPKAFTQEGKAQVDEEVLAGLELRFPVAKLLKEHFLVVKRIGQLGEGNQSWLKHCDRTGRIHGRVNSVGAVTRRMTHNTPNLAQVPSVRAEYGQECRELFCAAPGKVLVGCDADALELRCLAGYMANFDGGAYIKTVLEGKKEDGTDMHSINAKVLGCSRDTAKTWFYAFIYGAGDYKLGLILGKGSAAGKESRAKFMRALPALAKLVLGVQRKVKERGFILSLDKAPLHVRSSHAALNTLLQSAGAIIMKRAQVILDERLRASGYLPSVNYEFVATVHDEFVIECDPASAEVVGEAAAQAIRDAGPHYSFKCPLEAQYQIGQTWADIH